MTFILLNTALHVIDLCTFEYSSHCNYLKEMQHFNSYVSWKIFFYCLLPIYN